MKFQVIFQILKNHVFALFITIEKTFRYYLEGYNTKINGVDDEI